MRRPIESIRVRVRSRSGWTATIMFTRLWDAIAAGRLDPPPSVGAVISLDEVPDALDLARKSDGPRRIVVHPNGDVK
jgi:threonine dehydrogenase-like Zn-dependent dehydrogenase